MAKPLKFQIIEKAKELIQDERHWCRGYLAVDAYGDSADPTTSEAVRRCALGALIAAAYQLTSDRVRGYAWPLTRYDLYVEAIPLCSSMIIGDMLKSWRYSMKRWRHSDDQLLVGDLRCNLKNN